jgi:uncharacterized membrane protein
MPVELLPQRRLSDELRTGTSPDLTRRRWAIGLSFAGAVIGAVVGAYQTGIIRRLPDVLPGEVWDAERVDASDYAYRNLQQPDAPMMIVTYGLTAMAFAAGGADRARQNPALPLIASVKAAGDLALCLVLAAQEWRENGKLCSWCQFATAISAATLLLSVPEARRAWAARGRRVGGACAIGKRRPLKPLSFRAENEERPPPRAW